LSQYRLKPAPPHAAASTPKLSEADVADLDEGIALFNAGKFWEAHEAWEQIWRRRDESWRFFIQGLIQIAAAHHQLRRGIRHGAIKHLKNALAKLDSAPKDFVGLSLDRFRQRMHALLHEIEFASPEDFEKLQRGAWTKLGRMV
jgi:predicted metal-dependent hydrolase